MKNLLLLLVATFSACIADFGSTMLQLNHRVVFALHQENLQYLTFLLNENPEKRLSREEVGMITSNRVKRLKLLEFITVACQNAVVIHETLYGEYFVVDAPGWVWEHVFQTTFDPVQHGDKILLRGTHMTMPLPLHGIVSHVFNVVGLPPLVVPHLPPKLINETMLPTNEYQTTTPPLLNRYYRVPTSNGNPTLTGSTQSVFASLQQVYDTHDLSLFRSRWNLPDTGNIVRNVGGPLPFRGGVPKDFCHLVPSQCAEATLDLQYLVGINPWASTTFWYTSELVDDDVFLEW